MKNSSSEIIHSVAQYSRPLLTKSEFRELDFPLYNGNTYFSWSPKRVFDSREDKDFLTEDGHETLQTYLSNNDLHDIAKMLLNTNSLPRKGSLISIYRSLDSECGSEYGAILPGAAVSTSLNHAKWLSEIEPTANRALFASKVYPDELLTHGNPEDFIYIPRSLQVGFDRYLADTERAQM